MTATMTDGQRRALDALSSADRAVRERVERPMRSLDPSRARATPLQDLGALLLTPKDDFELCVVFGERLGEILKAQVEHFPETIFWDVDFLATSLITTGREGGPGALEELADGIIRVQAQYGSRSLLRFRYTHDFTYGFDWAKWVARAPASRAATGPFSPDFLKYLAARGEELVALIEADDDKYPKLPDGMPRNPFGFAREPEHEAALFLELAARELLPVQTWSLTTGPCWDGDFATRREACALELGIPTRNTRSA